MNESGNAFSGLGTQLQGIEIEESASPTAKFDNPFIGDVAKTFDLISIDEIDLWISLLSLHHQEEWRILPRKFGFQSEFHSSIRVQPTSIDAKVALFTNEILSGGTI